MAFHDLETTEYSQVQRQKRLVASSRVDYEDLLSIQQLTEALLLRGTLNPWQEHPPIPTTLNTDQRLFVRAFNDESRCSYDPKIGITCSDSTECRPHGSFGGFEREWLEQRLEVSVRSAAEALHAAGQVGVLGGVECVIRVQILTKY